MLKSILLLVFYLLTTNFTLSQQQLNNLLSFYDNIEFEAIRKSDRSIITLSNHDIKIYTQNIRIDSNSSIFEQLNDRKIYYNGEALSIIYDLNPSIDAEDLQSDVNILLPRLVIPKKYNKLIEDGYLISITTNYSKKKDFINTIKLITSLVDSLYLSNLPNEEYNMKVYSLIEELIEGFQIISNTINNKVIPLEKEIIIEKCHELIRFHDIIQVINDNHNWEIDSTYYNQLVWLKKSIEKTLSKLIEQKSLSGINNRIDKKVKVAVELINPVDNSNIHNMRIVLATEAMYYLKISEAYTQSAIPTSPSVLWLNKDGIYRIWAIKPGDLITNSISEEFKIDVSSLDKDMTQIKVFLK